MPTAQEPHLHLEIAHVLFMDVVGYSKLLVNEQREIMQQLNQLVRKTAQFQTSEANGKLISIPSGDAGHILISKRVADDLAQDSLWQPLLHEVGQIEVKHGVKLGIANLYTEELGNPQTPKKLSHLQPQTKFTPSDHALNVPEKSIAVLPFENLSADPENVFFADGVQDEILTNLAKIADLKVTSR